ncbi:MAG: DUF952 domain-containing protein [Hyphomicrobiaceae bacterium]
MEEWQGLYNHGRFSGSADDLRDGFIHLSTWAQLAGTLQRHFSRPDDREVVVARISCDEAQVDVRWEASRGGELFPHLYAGLQLEHVKSVIRLTRTDTGHYVVPAEPAT